MTFDISKKVSTNFNDTLGQVADALKGEGFGIISEIDLKDKFREKLQVDFRNYKILGACNPAYAHEAIGMEDKIGLMLPCNVLVQEHENGQVEVSAINPLASIGNLGNAELMKLAELITQKLRAAINKL
jgi:uncharacterized protein (DUF302 family)